MATNEDGPIECRKKTEMKDQHNNSQEKITDPQSPQGTFEFDSQECAAMAHDLAILQLPGADQNELNFSVADLELVLGVAKGDFQLGGNDETD